MVDAVTTNAAASRINSGGTMLASNFETFLALLTSQLKNQEPLSPVDSNQFTGRPPAVDQFALLLQDDGRGIPATRLRRRQDNRRVDHQ